MPNFGGDAESENGYWGYSLDEISDQLAVLLKKELGGE